MVSLDEKAGLGSGPCKESQSHRESEAELVEKVWSAV